MTRILGEMAVYFIYQKVGVRFFGNVHHFLQNFGRHQGAVVVLSG